VEPRALSLGEMKGGEVGSHSKGGRIKKKKMGGGRGGFREIVEISNILWVDEESVLSPPAQTVTEVDRDRTDRQRFTTRAVRRRIAPKA